MKQSPLNLKERLSENDVDSEVYKAILSDSNLLKIELAGNKEKIAVRNLLANYAYLVYEVVTGIHVQRKNINYQKLRTEIKYPSTRVIIQELIRKHVPSITDFDFWLQDDVDVLTMGMDAETKRFNKHIFH